MRRKTSVEDFEALFTAQKRTEESMKVMDDASMPVLGEDVAETSETADQDPMREAFEAEKEESASSDNDTEMTSEETQPAIEPEDVISEAEDQMQSEAEVSEEPSEREISTMDVAEDISEGTEEMASEEPVVSQVEEEEPAASLTEEEKIQPVNEEIAFFFADQNDQPTAALHLNGPEKPETLAEEKNEDDEALVQADEESTEQADEAAESKDQVDDVQRLLDHEAAQDLQEMEEAEERYKKKRRKKKKKKKNRHLFGKFLSFVQMIISVVLICVLAYYDLVPEKYLIIGGAALGGLFVLTFAMQYKRGIHILGKLISLILSAVMVIGMVYLGKTMSTLDTVTAVKNYQTDKVAVVVLADSKYETIDDVLGEKFGIMTASDLAKVDRAIEQIEEAHNVTIKRQTYGSYTDLVNDLYSGKIKVMVYNQAMNELIEDQNEGFLEKIKILDTESVETEVLMDDVPDLPVTEEPFIVYLSGLDVYDGMEETSRSDVNIMACVNPVSKQILLVSVPRDAFVTIPGVTGEGGADKLTHAGMYGVNYSIAAMENIFDVDINYYGRINFTAFLMMVDALGGVDVDSDYAFSTYYKQYDPDTKVWEYFYYDKGINHLDGRHALAFARERMNSAIGDYQRARNQEKVITALVDKLQSPAVLTGYTGLLDSMEGHVDTNFTSQQLASLVKMQLNDGAKWNIVMSSVYGYPSSEYCASYGEAPLDVEILDSDSINAVKEVIADLFAGKVISEPRKTDIQEQYTMNESEADSDYYLHQHASDDEYDDFYWENGGADADGTQHAPDDVKRKQQEWEQQQQEAPAEEEHYEEEYREEEYYE